MPPLVCPGPAILDQRSLESPDELRAVMRAVVAIADGIQNGSFRILLTDPLRSFIRDCDLTFDWGKVSACPQLGTIYGFLVNLGLQQAGVERLDLSMVTGHEAHPLPRGDVRCPYAAEWADEMGKVLIVHERCRSGRAFIGVGCSSAFSGGDLGQYENPRRLAHLPLVGPLQICELDEADDWDVRPEWKDRVVTFSEVQSNIHLLGGKIERPSGSSHWEVKFKSGRTWPLDSNFREIPERYIAQLVPLAKLDLATIKFVLCEGKLPQRRSRLKVKFG